MAYRRSYGRRYTSRRPSYGRYRPRSRYGMRRPSSYRRSGGAGYTGQSRRGYRPTSRRFYYGGRFF